MAGKKFKVVASADKKFEDSDSESPSGKGSSKGVATERETFDGKDSKEGDGEGDGEGKESDTKSQAKKRMEEGREEGEKKEGDGQKEMEEALKMFDDDPAEAFGRMMTGQQMIASGTVDRLSFLEGIVEEHEATISFLREAAASNPDAFRSFDLSKLIPEAMGEGDIVFEHFDDMIDLADERMNIMLYGPTGSGKSHVARQLAQKLQLPFYSQSCSEGMNESVFMGMKVPGDGGKWNYEPSRFVQFFQHGGVYLMDEMDAADANLLVYPNTAISNGWLSLELDGGRMVQRHPNFILIGTANSAGHGGDSSYLRNELDVATLRRFKTGMIHVPYSEKVEAKLIDHSVMAWGEVMRKVIDDLGVERMPVSTGLLIDYTTMKLNKKWNPKRWTSSFLEGMNKDQCDSIRSRFKEIVDHRRAEVKREAEKVGLELET